MKTLFRTLTCCVMAAALPACAMQASAAPFMGPSAAGNPNVEIALGYIRTVWIEHKPEEGYARFVAPDYKHYPPAPGGGAGGGIAGLLEKFPNFTYEVKQVFADGDFVIVHAFLRGVPGEGDALPAAFPGAPERIKTGDEVVDIFHISKGRIVGHWDTVEPATAPADTLF